MFTKIDELIWTDEKYKRLSDDGKFLFLYVLSCPHRNILGFYFLPIPYASFDLNWEVERLKKGLEELLNNGFINYNFNTNIIFIKNFLRYNPLENPNQVKGAIKALQVLPTNSIDAELVAYLKTVDKPFIEPLLKLLNERLGKQEDVYVDVEEDIEEQQQEEISCSSFKNNDISKIATEFQQNGFGTISSTVKEMLVNLLDEYSVEWIIEAIKIAVKNNKRTLKYVEGILQNWRNQGGMKLESDKKTSTLVIKKTRFHNFQQRSDEYTEEELEKKVDDIADRKKREFLERMKGENES